MTCSTIKDEFYKFTTFDELVKFVKKFKKGCMRYIGVSITPALAEEMLKHNHARENFDDSTTSSKNYHGNREIKSARVSAYVQLMMNGTWQLTADPISFNSNYELLNGQHRLKAIVESGITVDFIVCFFAPDTYAYDSGLPRNKRDQLLLSDGSIPYDLLSDKKIASAVTFYLSFTSGRTYRDISTPEFESFVKDNMTTLTKVKNICDTCIKYATNSKDRKTLGSAIIYIYCLILLLLYRDMVSESDIEEFLEIYMSGGIPNDRKEKGTIKIHEGDVIVTLDNNTPISTYEKVVNPVVFAREDIMVTPNNINLYIVKVNRLLSAMADYMRVKAIGVSVIRKGSQSNNSNFMVKYFSQNISPYTYYKEIDTGRKSMFTKTKKEKAEGLYAIGTSVEKISEILNVRLESVKEYFENK